MTDVTLHVIATPIGNRDDLSPRAREILAGVDVIAAEDTRRTGRLLSHFGIRTPLLSLHEHNEDDAAARVIERLGAGHSAALVSDAGTPLISDPGYRLLRMAHAGGFRVSPVPGPSAATAALSVSGLATDRFCFEGFLPPRRAARRARLAELARETRTVVVYEAVHRIRDTLDDAVTVFGDTRPAFLGRELTKLHEQCTLATLAELRDRLADGGIATKGEFVLLIEGASQPPDTTALDVDRLLEELAAVLPARRAAAVASAVSGRPRNELYRRLLELTSRS